MNKSIAVSRVFPQASAIHARVAGSHFHDSYSIDVANASRTALGHFFDTVAQTPGWVNVLMAMRNRVVALFGLKHLGHLGKVDAAKPEQAYAPGDRVGIFTLVSNTPDEVILEDNDKHLHVMLSVLRLPPGASGTRAIAVSTVVHIHNTLGRLYMIPVAPIHKLIVPSVLARIARIRPAA
ncbi:MAG TPA: DUF2867 domain-containing protein [Burkholderiaceae bacterium]|nr:DUF2867 domain-containing protein [Burkholderiaceae bacterium]